MPNTTAVSAEAEAGRVVPLVERLAREGALVSVDTWKPKVARAAVDAGAALVNDVSGLRDPELTDVCADSGAGLVIMHTRAEPKVKAFPGYDDVVARASVAPAVARPGKVRVGTARPLGERPDVGRRPRRLRVP